MSNHTNTSATDGQNSKIAELIGTTARTAIKQLGLSKDDAQTVIQKGGDLKAALLPQFLQVFRSLIAKFNPAEFIGNGWYIDQKDEQLPAAPSDIDPKDVVFKNMHRPCEMVLNGEKRLRRHREAGNLCLTADHFFCFWKKREQLPEEWKQTEAGETRYIYFDATILRGPGGDRFALYLCWLGGAWRWDYVWLGRDFYSQSQSAVAGK
jgi:hypothetical protein